MIHAKGSRLRLAYVPWLLAIGLALIELTATPAAAIRALTATPNVIREDAGQTTITLKVTLQYTRTQATSVSFTFENSLSGNADFDEGAQVGERDQDYTATVAPLSIAAGQTEGTTTLTLTPINNSDKHSAKVFKLVAVIGDTRAHTGIKITDDETPSTAIWLTVNPSDVKAGAGATEVEVTGTLNGKAFANDVSVRLVIDSTVGNAAQRDIDYATVPPTLTIPAGQSSGSTTMSITALNGGNKQVGLKVLQNPKNEEDVEVKVGTATITLRDAYWVSPDAEPEGLTFASGLPAPVTSVFVDRAMPSLFLPPATGGTGALRYFAWGLPNGLSFDESTRTISGTPTTVGTYTIIYTAIDSAAEPQRAETSFTIKVVEFVAMQSTHSWVREDSDTTVVTLTAALEAALAADETVRFELGAPSAGLEAVRDVDYEAKMEVFTTIPAGQTEGTTTLILTPIDNTNVDGPRFIGVRATFSSGDVVQTDIKIADDEIPSSSVVLSVTPDTISEEAAGSITNLTITGTLDGKELNAAANITIAIDLASSTATRDLDYSALITNPLVIPAGSIAGSTDFFINPVEDEEDEGSEIIRLNGSITGSVGTNLVVSSADITLTDLALPASTLTDSTDASADSTPTPLTFAGASVANQTYTEGQTTSTLVLPAASGGTGSVTYSISANLPAGLSFDPVARTIAGTPTAATTGAVTITYTATDSNGTSVSLTFTITVNAGLSFGDFFNFLGKVVPTASHDLAAIREFAVGQRVEGIVLPEASGGTAPLVYSLSPALPAGLSFDAATRTIAGTPQTAGETVYTYTVTDANGVTASLVLQTRPSAFSLADNFPNPFNPATTIKYALPTAADVELTVYNVAGQVVRTLVAAHQSAGWYVAEWDATDDSGHSVSAGLYFYRLQAGGESAQVKKMLLLK